MYQSASRVISKYVDGPMIKIKMEQVDALITPDHNMFAAPRTHLDWNYEFVPASSFLDRCYRIRMGGGFWDGDIHCPEVSALIGFIAADGNVASTAISFNLRKPRKSIFI